MNALKRLASHPQLAAVGAALHGDGTAAGHAAQLIRLASFSCSTQREAGTTANAAAAPGPLYSACLLERLPVVMPQVPEWEVEHAVWQQQLLARHRKELPASLVDPRRDEASGESRWQPAPLKTEADRAGDRRSLRRRLDQRIFFMARRRPGTGAAAAAAREFVHVELAPGETTRAGAERALAEALGGEGYQPYFVGNAPAGHVAVPGGGTLFFHRCQLIQGQPALLPGGRWVDHVWAAKDELHEYVQDEGTLSLLRKML